MPATTWDDVFADLEVGIRRTMGDFDNELVIRPSSTFREDLGMESIDLVALAGQLQSDYDGSVNLALFILGEDVDFAADVRVDQLVDYIAESLGIPGPGPAEVTADGA